MRGTKILATDIFDPEWLGLPPLTGYAARMAHWIQDNIAIKPRKSTAYFATLFFITTLCARHFKWGGRRQAYPLVYMIVHAPSGTGKNDIINGCEALANAVRCSDLIINYHGWTSDTGLHVCIKDHPQSGCIVDEYGAILKKMLAANNRIEHSILALMREAYSKSHTTLRPKSYATNDARKEDRGKNIVRPCMSILGLTTEVELRELSMDFMGTGDLPRQMIFQLESNPIYERGTETEKLDVETCNYIIEIIALNGQQAPIIADPRYCELPLTTEENTGATIKWLPEIKNDAMGTIKENIIERMLKKEIKIYENIEDIPKKEELTNESPICCTQTGEWILPDYATWTEPIICYLEKNEDSGLNKIAYEIDEEAHKYAETDPKRILLTRKLEKAMRLAIPLQVLGNEHGKKLSSIINRGGKGVYYITISKKAMDDAMKIVEIADGEMLKLIQNRTEYGAQTLLYAEEIANFTLKALETEKKIEIYEADAIKGVNLHKKIDGKTRRNIRDILESTYGIGSRQDTMRGHKPYILYKIMS